MMKMLAIAALTLSMSAVAHAQSGDFAGNVTDAATGYDCVTPACDTVRLPGTDCLCQKQNPNEQMASRVMLDCRAPAGSSAMCVPAKSN